LWEGYRVLAETPPGVRDYFMYKTGHVLFSYYATALLVSPDRREGRFLARALRDKVKAGAGDYFMYKMGHVLFSYYVTALLVNPDRREGRLLARVLREKVRTKAAELEKATRLRYRGTLVLHRLGITWRNIQAVQHTGVYRLLFKAAS
jgi:lipocalin